MRTQRKSQAPPHVVERAWNWAILPLLAARLDMLEGEWMRSRRIPREARTRAREVTEATRMRLGSLADLCGVDINANETPRNPSTPLWLLAGAANRDRRRAMALRASVDRGLEALEQMIDEVGE